MNKLITLCVAGLLAGGSLQAMQNTTQLSKEELCKKLIMAANKGEFTAVQNLLDQGAPINCVSLFYTALQWAILKQHPKVARLLIEKGADVNQLNEHGTTALHEAAMGMPEIVELLINRGAEVNRADRAGDTALLFAVSRDHLEVARLLIDAMLKPTKEQKQTVTALIDSLKKTKTNARDTNKLIIENLIATQKQENKARVLEQINKIQNEGVKKELLEYMNQNNRNRS